MAVFKKFYQDIMTFLENDDDEMFDEDFSIAVDDFHIACEVLFLIVIFAVKFTRPREG